MLAGGGAGGGGDGGLLVEGSMLGYKEVGVGVVGRYEGLFGG